MGFAFAGAAIIGSASAAHAQEANILSVASGSSIVLHTAGLSRVAVGDGRIAGVVPIGTSQLVINGKSPGQTTLLIWAASGRQIYDVVVTEQNVDTIAKMIRARSTSPAFKSSASGNRSS